MDQVTANGTGAGRQGGGQQSAAGRARMASMSPQELHEFTSAGGRASASSRSHSALLEHTARMGRITRDRRGKTVAQTGRNAGQEVSVNLRRAGLMATYRRGQYVAPDDLPLIQDLIDALPPDARPRLVCKGCERPAGVAPLAWVKQGRAHYAYCPDCRARLRAPRVRRAAQEV